MSITIENIILKYLQHPSNPSPHVTANDIADEIRHVIIAEVRRVSASRRVNHSYFADGWNGAIDDIEERIKKL